MDLLGESILKKNSCSDLNIKALIDYLSLSLKEGHLCVRLEGDSLIPSFEEGEKDKVIQGIRSLPESFYGIIKEGNFVYFQKYWYFENQVKTCLEPLLKEEPSPLLSRKVKEEGLFEEQIKAIESCLANRLTILCGGPGTGKTYTAGKLLKVLWEALPQKRQESFQIALAAPTGKAAAHLCKSLNLPAETGTLHSLLNRFEKLPFDLILVDESSMIDVKMMAKLLSSLKMGSRLVLLGDPNQLPPVEAGHLFFDIVQTVKIRVITLQKVLRTDRREMIAFADAVKKGETSKAFSLLEGGHQGLLEFPLQLEELLEDAFQRFDLLNISLEQFRKFSLLSPFRKGPFGVEALNQALYDKIFSRIPYGKQVCLPILLAKNAPHLNLFNGELGLLVGKKEKVFQPEVALFEGTDGEVRHLSPYLLPKYELAFCLSVHKSQGSEFDRVHLVLPPGSATFGREVLYTGATRAKTCLALFTDRQTLEDTIASPTIRLSGLL